jgi:hypothetical protein
MEMISWGGDQLPQQSSQATSSTSQQFPTNQQDAKLKVPTTTSGQIQGNWPMFLAMCYQNKCHPSQNG